MPAIHSFLVSLAFQASIASAWGILGHETVALIAQKYVSPDTAKYCQTILGDTSSTYLATVATWADSYRLTAAGKFSAPYHFIDAEDSPPHACNVDLQRDCGPGGCVVEAISNYTSRVKDTSLPASERLAALKFIVHFVGDVHQPLHDEALDLGGNHISVTFAGKSRNLHAIWDTDMPEKLISGHTISNAQNWAANLTSGITSGVYSSEKSAWLSGIDINDPTSTALGWARDSNSYVCSTVMPAGVSAVENVDLSGAYYQNSIVVIELQIAKAGYRLAAWLNLIATGNSSLAISKLKVKREPLTYLEPGDIRDFSPAKLARREHGHVC